MHSSQLLLQQDAMNCICKAKLERQCHILCTAPAEPGNAEACGDILTWHRSSCGAVASSEEIACPHVPIAFRDWLCHSLKTSLQKKVSQDSMDLSGIPLTMRDVHRMAYYLQNNGDRLTSVDLSFTELNDDMVRLLLPFLWALPKLTHLSLNGNRLTRATMKELTDTMKDMNKFPCLAWVDLGNNVDVSSMPQPLLVGLRKRLSQQTTLPTIYEALDCDSEIAGGHEGSQPEDEAAGSTPPRAFSQQGCER
ncbi:hypothetical protein DV515_00011422 [Chloebia gouldiae]|uniref:LR75B protein n=1 Tax=Chloebia gouldiae TaxID=44316 RepID=A0A3L8S662_CHLGU|nr:hypothetical protein DV515_00011422 [Chloebia gouldiae]